jgi:hypothetical protein
MTRQDPEGILDTWQGRFWSLRAECQKILDYVHALPYEPSNSVSTRIQDMLVDALARTERWPATDIRTEPL